MTHTTPDCIATVRDMIGRRHKIGRREMAGLLRRLASEGLDLSNDCVPPGGDTPEGWAARCTGICTVSVLADGATPHGAVRYDDPGSMHPMHQAALMFAPADLAADNSTLAYLRSHASRVLIVDDDSPAAAVPAEPDRVRYECDNGHVWHATEAEADDRRCPVCGECWV